MPHTVVESDAYSANVVVPDPGELVKAADVENAVQPIANRTKNHELHGFFDTTKLAAGNGNVYKLGIAGRLDIAAGSQGIQALQTGAAHSTTLSGWHERSGMMYRSGGEAREKLRANMALDADSDITVELDVWFLPQATANHTRTVRLTFPTFLQIGEMIRIVRVRNNGAVGGFAETIVSESGQTLFIFGNGYQGYVLLMYGPKMGGGNDWLPIGWHVEIPGAGSGVWGM